MPTPAALLMHLRLVHLRNAWRLLGSTSRLRVWTVAASCAITWGSLFAFSMFAFNELKTRHRFPIDGWFQELLFDVMFFFLSSLLLFSTAILMYSGLFTASESRYLLTTPLPDDQIFAYKFQSALAFSNWGFLLLGSPVLIAYGLSIEGGAGWTFFAALPFFFLGFVLMPGSVGAIACLLLVNYLPRSGAQLLKWAAAFLGLLLLLWIDRTLRRNAQGFQPTRLAFENFVNQLAILSGDLLPHHWVAAGLRAAALGETRRVWYYLGLVWSNGLLLYVVAIWLGKQLFRRGVERVTAGGSLLGTRARSVWLDNLVQRALFFLDRPTRLLIVKDFRTFRRDPAQWLQIFIFVGLLLFYFWGMRSFFERDIATPFRNGISLLTLAATALLMCAYTGRFIFPLLSLEGRTFWLLGLLPLDRGRLVWGKFAFSSCTCLAPCLILIAACDAMIGIDRALLVVHLATVVLVGVGLSALSVGLGTLIPNFRETDPSKIATGFGGTMNLVVGFLYLLIVMMLVAVPLHVVHARRDIVDAGPTPVVVWILLGIGVGVSVATVFGTLRMAARHLERMEF